MGNNSVGEAPAENRPPSFASRMIHFLEIQQGRAHRSKLAPSYEVLERHFKAAEATI
jgi:hypothetical protein